MSPPKRVIFACLLLAVACAAEPGRKRYDVDYRVEFLPKDGVAAVTIALESGTGKVSRLRMRMKSDRYTAVTGDGRVAREGDYVVWEPPAEGGALRYRYRIDHQRNGGAYDARITDRWAIVRGDDLFPSAATRMTRRTDSRARLRFELPEGWTNVDTPYRLARNGREFVVVDPERRFDRPVGWIIAGDVGTRREMIADTEVSVAGPKGEPVRRNDVLAFANLALPEMKRAFGALPSKLLIVRAADPMWRGGLSGPRSLFLHADRPLISENGTSSLLHELFHVVTRIRGASDDDWIAEGLAEYYSIELPRRTGMLSQARYDKALEWMRNFGKGVERLRTKRSKGPVTARAAVLFHELDLEIANRTRGEHRLDDVTRALIPIRVVSRENLREIVAELTGAPSGVLGAPLVRRDL